MSSSNPGWLVRRSAVFQHRRTPLLDDSELQTLYFLLLVLAHPPEFLRKRSGGNVTRPLLYIRSARITHAFLDKVGSFSKVFAVCRSEALRRIG